MNPKKKLLEVALPLDAINKAASRESQFRKATTNFMKTMPPWTPT